MPVYFINKPERKNCKLDQEESRHAIKVLRLRKDDNIELVDGEGNLYRARISEPDPISTGVRILEKHENHLKRDYYLHLAIAPTKSTDRFEWFLEKATEIGIDEITPILCERSERRRIRQERSEKVLISAMKQSGRASLPRLNKMTGFGDFLGKAEADMKYIAHCGTGEESFLSSPSATGPVWIVCIGPEGDFSPAELKKAGDAGFRDLNLGEAVYRTETAGIMVCQQVALHNRPK